MSVGSRRLRVATVEVGTVGSTSGSRGSVGKRQVGRPKKLPSQVRNQPAIHRFFGSVNDDSSVENKADDLNEEDGDSDIEINSRKRKVESSTDSVW